MSNLQPHVLERLSNWYKSPLLFVNECFEWKKGTSPTPQQIEGLMGFAKNKRMSIRSGHGTGKSTLSAWISLNFISTRPYSKVVVTAPTNRQLYDIYWAELAKWFRRSKLQDEFVQQKDKFFHKSAPKDWWIRLVSPQARATKDEQAETLAGFHGDHLLIICDEASGIADPVFIPLEGALTQEDNKVILLGNPTKNHGYFYDTHFHRDISKKWHHLHWDSRESPIVTKEMVDYFETKYGIDSNVFAIRIVGNPPTDDQNTLISLAWARQCLGNEIEVAEDEPLYLGVDVARYGEDTSVILPRRGLKIYPWDTHRNLNTIDLGGHINQVYGEMEARGISIDEIGVGAGVTDWLMKHGNLRTFGINVSSKSSDIKKYDRLRDELWCAVRDKCMRGVYSFPDTTEGEELCNELAMPSYTFNINGGIKVESKREMKARGVASPNIADALCLTEYFSNTAHKVWPVSVGRSLYRKMPSTPNYGEHGWMVC